MTVVGIDDTDSRETGMCTTFAAHRVAERLDGSGATVERVLLVRLNPAVEHKTRGNAALAVHTDADRTVALSIARDVVADGAQVEDDRTHPGVVVAPGDPTGVPDHVAEFASHAIRDHHEIDDAVECIETAGYESHHWGNGRGRIGALAAIGAWRSLGGPDGDWTYENVCYRESNRRGTEREVDDDSVFASAERYYPEAWDTVDAVEGQAVCVPHTPGPILYGIRGDDPEPVRDLASEIESEPVVASRLFVTNQGTDAHLQDATIETAVDGRAYRLEGTVVEPPETVEGGHVFLTIADPERELDRFDPDVDTVPSDRVLWCAAFEPTKRFRDRVRTLRVGDRITACGELAEGTLKLEKFAVRRLRTRELTTPECPACGRSMESAGADQGYRCRDCKSSEPGKVEREIDREIEPGWYEVPPCARRHVAKPLVRGGFDAAVTPER